MRPLALPQADWRLVIAGAVLTAAAYPPFHLVLPSFVCLVPAAWLILDGADDPRPARRHLAQGFWFGLAANGLVLHWIAVALWNYTPLSVIGFAAGLVGLALVSAILFAVTGWVIRTTGVSVLLVFPVVWVAHEWIVGHLGDFRFPWLGLGTSLTGYPTMVQIADIVGARGVTYLLALANVALALALRHRAEQRRAAVLAAGVVVGIVVALAYGVVRERTLDLRPVGVVTVIQPNIGFRDKWEPGQGDQIFSDHLRLSTEAFAAEAPRVPDLIVWPEVAMPGSFQRNPLWRVILRQFTVGSKTPLFVGALDLSETDDGRVELYNAGFLIGARDTALTYPVYHKRYLVPITERAPIAAPRALSRFFGGFTPGDELPVYEVEVERSRNVLRFGALICFESAFEDLARGYRQGGAEFLVNITNDVWFGHTVGPHQHAAHLVMRAIESRVGIARAANSGISEFVDPLGRIHEPTALNARTSKTREVLTAEGMSLYARFGDWVGMLSLLATALLVGYAVWRRR